MEPITLFSKILFCTDFSRESVAAFSYALELCRASKDAEIILFHVIPEPAAQFWKTYIYELDQIDEKAKEAIDQQFAEDYLSRVPAGTRVSTRVAVGNAGQQVISLVEKEKIDLIVMGRKRKKSPGVFFGDSAKATLQKAGCPILVVPED